ncbi:MAG TPA: carboxypeptidase-like regulatory domain-containing protein, partial [Prolixibacteraceae bacterium]|nr:carboxypeptidase-like regulatory domain-containing protein [Prolixibacteraceae bacterium]
MKTHFFLLLLIFTSLQSFAQITIKGNVTDENKEPLPGVNIYVEGSYDGGSSDANGCFNFTTTETDTKKIMASFIGFKTWEKEIDLSTSVAIDI